MLSRFIRASRTRAAGCIVRPSSSTATKNNSCEKSTREQTGAVNGIDGAPMDQRGGRGGMERAHRLNQCLRRAEREIILDCNLPHAARPDGATMQNAGLAKGEVQVRDAIDSHGQPESRPTDCTGKRDTQLPPHKHRSTAHCQGGGGGGQPTSRESKVSSGC